MLLSEKRATQTGGDLTTGVVMLTTGVGDGICCSLLISRVFTILTCLVFQG